MTVTFYIDAKTSKIFLQVIYLTKKIRISTGQKIDKQFWGTPGNKYRVSSKSLLSNSINTLLINWEVKARDVLIYAQLNDETVDEVQGKLYEALKVQIKEKKNPNNLINFFRTWATVGTATKTNPRRGDLYSFRVCWDFVKKNYNENIEFKDIDYNFYSNYVIYLKNDKGLRLNTVGTHIKNLKAVMSEAYKRGVHSNTAFMQFKKIEETVDNVYLTQEELDLLYNCDLDTTRAAYRDIFLIGCYTCMRYSDYSRLSKEWIRGNDTDGWFLEYTEQKTLNRNVIPMHARVLEIMKKYDYTLPVITQEQLNKNIKRICAMAGINTIITTTKIIADKKIIEKKIKCEMVTTHTARRTGVSNLIRLNCPLNLIMAMSGHKSMRSFAKYDKVESEKKAINLKEWTNKL